eukprot:961423-Pleurochrysis_carterae.AAC.1
MEVRGRKGRGWKRGRRDAAERDGALASALSAACSEETARDGVVRFCRCVKAHADSHGRSQTHTRTKRHVRVGTKRHNHRTAE